MGLARCRGWNFSFILAATLGWSPRPDSNGTFDLNLRDTEAFSFETCSKLVLYVLLAVRRVGSEAVGFDSSYASKVAPARRRAQRRGLVLAKAENLVSICKRSDG